MARLPGDPDKQACFCASGKTYEQCHGKPSIVPGLSHTKLSMIASALAIGEPFCCGGRGKDNRETVTGDPDELEAIEQDAYDGGGCTAWRAGVVPVVGIEDETEYFEPTNHNGNHEKQSARRCFENFMGSV